MSVLRTEKMHQIYIGFCVILYLICGCSSKIYKEGEAISIDCNTDKAGSMTFMFRISNKGASYLFTAKQTTIVNDNAEKYIGSVGTNGNVNLKIKSFTKTDSAVYTCATLNNNKLFFGEMIEIKGEPDPTTEAPKIVQKPTHTVTTTTKPSCKCKDPKPMLNCDTWILSSLACGCALLLLLLIFTILYCNRLRTRRCPHHYKRQPHPRPAGNPKLPNTHF